MPLTWRDLAPSIPDFSGSNRLAVAAGQTITGGLRTLAEGVGEIADQRQEQFEVEEQRAADALRGSLDIATATAVRVEDKRELADTIIGSALSEQDKGAMLATLIPALTQQAGSEFDAANAPTLEQATANLSRVNEDNPLDNTFTFRNDITVGGVVKEFVANNNIDREGFDFTGRLGGGQLESELQSLLAEKGFGGNSDIARYALLNSPIRGENYAWFSFDAGIDRDVLSAQLDNAIEQYGVQQRNRDRRDQAQVNFNSTVAQLRLDKVNHINQFTQF